MIAKETLFKILEPRDLVLGGAFVALLVAGSFVHSNIYRSVDTSVCSMDNFAADMFEAWDNYKPLENVRCYDAISRDMSRAEAREYQREFEALMAEDHPRVGYKIGIHEPSQQRVFGLDGPVFGVFYGDDAFHEDGAIIDAKGQKINFEPDFLLRVGDERINDAKTVEEVAEYIDRAYAFIELPASAAGHDDLPGDALFPNFRLMQATNLAARYGVIGEYMDAKDDPNFAENLRNMQVVATNYKGQSTPPYEVANDDTHPLVTALLTAEFLKERGEKLEVGDVISVGAMLAFIGNSVEWELPGIDNEVRHVNYYIGDKMLHVSVGFEDSVRGTRYE
ncbi:MAG: hypothetical protein ACRBBQ_16925 [Cognatishimia sp.]